ncbi:MAG: hypothetical protein RLZZ385_2014 [Pseudomonadota bacterium]
MEYLIEYGMFLAKAATIVIAIALVIGIVAAASQRQRRSAEDKGHIKVSKLNEHLEKLQEAVQKAVLDKDAFKQLQKQKKLEHKQQRKMKKAQVVKTADASPASNTSADTGESQDTASPAPAKRVYVLNFKGDIAANAVSNLREEVTAVLSMAQPQDEVILRLESPGGMVHAYGLASSQLARIKDRRIALTICVDKVAASGGYMMACLADRLVAAPFAVIGSIGVLVQMPNFHRLLKKNEIDFETITAGEFKTTLTTFGEITQKGRDKVKGDVEDMHDLFKRWVKTHRPSVDIDRISTGETWVGLQAKDRYMVDELRTSDEVIVSACDNAEVFEVEFEQRQSLQNKMSNALRGSTAQLVDELSERINNYRFFS